MPRFEFREQRHGQYEAIGVRLCLDGVLLRESEVTEGHSGEKYLRLTTPESARGLMQINLDEIEHEFGQITVPLTPPICKLCDQVTVRWRLLDRDRSESRRVIFTIPVDSMEWARPWSITAMLNTLHQVVERSTDLACDKWKSHPQPIKELHIYAPLTPNVQDLEELIEFWRPRVETVLAETIAILSSDVARDSLITLFDFPPPIKAACQQYLAYFVQFLDDLGIEASSEMREIAQRVLFSVTPTKGAEALDRIRDALEIYLRLPASPEFAAQAPAHGDIAVRQLLANIHHLNGQLVIAGAVLEAKNARIEALQLANFTYQQLLATQQQIAAIPLPPPGSADADAEPLVPGVIDVTKYEGKGFTVNFAEILRRLKRRWDQD